VGRIARAAHAPHPEQHPASWHPGSCRAINSDSEAVKDAQHTTTRPHAPCFSSLPPFRGPGSTLQGALVVRSFMTQVTISDDAIITIQRVRQHQIRLITRRGFGYHSQEAVIALAMLTLGGLCPPLPGR
jgi:hypothetical protein